MAIGKEGRSGMGCWGEDSEGQATVPHTIWGGVKGIRGIDNDIDVDRSGSDCEEMKREIVALNVGNATSAGVDSSGEMHIWGKMKYTPIPRD